MSELNDLLRAYATESGDLVTEQPIDVDTALQGVLADELEVATQPRLEEKLQHAEKAEMIADQLDVLADRADEQAAEDKSEVIAEISAESLNREFGTIMAANGLSLKAASFESAVEPRARLTGLATDARRTAKIVRSYSEEINDVSTEGAIMQFLRRDKARLEAARTALKAAGTAVAGKKGELNKEAVALDHDGLRRFLIVKGEPVTNVKAAIKHDAEWLKKCGTVLGKLTNDLTAAIKAIPKEGDNAAALAKLKSLAESLPGLDALNNDSLLGNHAVGSSGKHGGGEKGDAGAATMAYMSSSLKAAGTSVALIVGGAVVGAAVGGGVGGIGGAVAGAVGGYAAGVGAAVRNVANKTSADYKKRVDGSNTKSCIGAGDFQEVVNTVLGFEQYTDFTNDQKVDEVYSHIQGIDKEAAAAAKKALSRLMKVADTMYEHAIYVTVKTAQLASAAAKAA